MCQAAPYNALLIKILNENIKLTHSITTASSLERESPSIRSLMEALT